MAKSLNERSQCYENLLGGNTLRKMRNIYTSFVPFYWIAKLLGLFPFSYEGVYCNGIFIQKRRDIALTLTFFMIFMFLYIANFFRNESVSSSSDILARAWDLSLYFFLTTLLVSYLYQLKKWKSIVKFLSLIKHFDEKVCNLRSLY